MRIGNYLAAICACALLLTGQRTAWGSSLADSLGCDLYIDSTATSGGNICRASPTGETLAPLLVLEATASCAFSDGQRNQPFMTFFQGPGKSVLGGKGLLTEIDVPYPAASSKGVYLKHAVRGAMDIAMVGVAVLITPDAAKSNIQDVRIGLGAVAPTPVRAPKTEALLRG